MLNCPKCGVEFEEMKEFCPLCGYNEHNEQSQSESQIQSDGKVLPGYIRLTQRQKRKLFWEISMMVLFSGILVTTVIDLLATKSITWSKYTITVSLVLFANITLASFLRQRLFLFITGSFLTTSLLIVLLDVYNERIGWGTQLGIPLLFSLYLVSFGIVIVFRYSKQHGFNLLGFIFLAIGLLSVCTDGIISMYVNNAVILRWSLIVMVCILPVTAILFYIHYRLNKGAELRKFFNI